MKIAVATEDGKTICAHFGRAPFFAIYEVNGRIIIGKNLRENNFTGHFRGRHEHHHKEHRPGSGDSHSHQSVAEGLKDCQVVISNGMGRKAWEDLRAKGIEMIVTEQTDVEKAVQMYINGELNDRTDMLH